VTAWNAIEHGAGRVQFAQINSTTWIAYIRVAESGDHIYMGSSAFYERTWSLGDCMKTVRQWILDMQMQLENDFTVITRCFDIGMQDNWNIVETAINAVWDDMDVIVCDG
jgi:hypothetical protein